MVKLDVKYSVVLDGESVVLEGIHNLPTEIEKDLVKRGFAKELSEKDVAPKELEGAKKIFLVGGKLTEKEPVQAGEEDSTDADDSDGEITYESLMAMTVEKIKEFAKEKGIDLKETKKEDLVKELLEILGA